MRQLFFPFPVFILRIFTVNKINLLFILSLISYLYCNQSSIKYTVSIVTFIIVFNKILQTSKYNQEYCLSINFIQLNNSLIK